MSDSDPTLVAPGLAGRSPGTPAPTWIEPSTAGRSAASGRSPTTREPACRKSAPRRLSSAYTRPGCWSCGRMPIQYVSVPKWLVCQCQYSIISAPRATKAHAACRHCPSNAGKLVADPPIAPALVSVIRNGRLLGGVHPVRREEQAPCPRGRPALRRDARCWVRPARPAWRSTGCRRSRRGRG